MKKIKNSDFLGQIKETIEQEKSNKEEPVAEANKINQFEQGLNLTKEIMSGSKVKTPRLLVDPNQCKVWEKHNRAYELLNDIRCKDLISQFKETGKQEFPGIVRLIEGGGEIKYEIICGARRFWTSKYLGWKYFVEIRDLSDEEAFRLSDIENRAREDISDYERAQDYKDALGTYYQNQVQMASRLEVSTSWLSRYLDLADLPEEIVKAYRDITEIKIIHARKLKPFFSGTSEQKINKEKILQKAVEIQGQGYDGAKVIAELLSVIKLKTKRSRPKTYFASKNGFVNMEIRTRRDKKIELLIEKRDSASKEDVIEFLTATLDKYFPD